MPAAKTPTPDVPPAVAKATTSVQSWVVKLGAVASTVAGAATAASHGLPGFESAILTAVGPLVFLVERYWADIRKVL